MRFNTRVDNFMDKTLTLRAALGLENKKSKIISRPKYTIKF